MKLRHERIKERLKELGLTKISLASELNISRQALDQTIKGNPSTTSIKKISDRLDMHPVELLELGEGFEHYYVRNKWAGIRRVRKK